MGKNIKAARASIKPISHDEDNIPEYARLIGTHGSHNHEWTFIRELELIEDSLKDGVAYGTRRYKAARFVCHCGAYKQPELKEVEE